MGRTASLVLAVVFALGCSSKPRVIVGAKNFTEQLLLGEIIAQHIETTTGVAVERKFNLGGTLLSHEALKRGGIDLYPEYTGTALTAVLKQGVSRDPAAVRTRVREGYAPMGLVWLEPLGFDNTFAMVVGSETARNDALRTLSDAAKRARPWRMGVGYEFVRRPDGLDGLVRTYRLQLEGPPVTMDLGLLYNALESGQVEMAAASATDARLADAAFTVLEDDQHYFPPYECAIVARRDVLDRLPQVRSALEQLSGAIEDDAMRRMNSAVDRDRRHVAEVAREFLAKRGG
jgi:glycine betaine/choline ABC-type transport system substrate-binding protein